MISVFRAQCPGWFDRFLLMLFLWGGPQLACVLAFLDKVQGHATAARYSLNAMAAFLLMWTPIGCWLFARLRRFETLQDRLWIRCDSLILTTVFLLRDKNVQFPLTEIRNLRCSVLREALLARSLEGEPTVGVTNFDSGNISYAFRMSLTRTDCQKLVDMLVNDYGIAKAGPGRATDQDARELLWSLED